MGFSMDKPVVNGDGCYVEPIAVIGMACRFSGDATSPVDFWNMLMKGRSGWSSNAGKRFKMDAFWHPQPDISGSVSCLFPSTTNSYADTHWLQV
jgi:hypothetical protein